MATDTGLDSIPVVSKPPAMMRACLLSSPPKLYELLMMIGLLIAGRPVMSSTLLISFPEISTAYNAGYALQFDAPPPAAVSTYSLVAASSFTVGVAR